MEIKEVLNNHFNNLDNELKNYKEFLNESMGLNKLEAERTAIKNQISDIYDDVKEKYERDIIKPIRQELKDFMDKNNIVEEVNDYDNIAGRSRECEIRYYYNFNNKKHNVYYYSTEDSPRYSFYQYGNEEVKPEMLNKEFEEKDKKFLEKKHVQKYLSLKNELANEENSEKPNAKKIANLTKTINAYEKKKTEVENYIVFNIEKQAKLINAKIDQAYYRQREEIRKNTSPLEFNLKDNNKKIKALEKKIENQVENLKIVKTMQVLDLINNNNLTQILKNDSDLASKVEDFKKSNPLNNKEDFFNYKLLKYLYPNTFNESDKNMVENYNSTNEVRSFINNKDNFENINLDKIKTLLKDKVGGNLTNKKALEIFCEALKIKVDVDTEFKNKKVEKDEESFND